VTRVPGSWEALYRSDLLGLWGLLVVPAVFLLALPWLRPRTPGADPRAAGFVRAWAVVWSVETILDPLSIVFAGVPMLLFVLLGDFRVFLLVLGVLEPERARAGTIARAAAWTLVVPAATWSLHRLVGGVAGPLPDQALWLVYESVFVVLALWWRHRLLPARRPVALRFLRAVWAYVAVYYALWALADVLIMIGGVDAGWALRIVPNQLYYGFFVPFAWWRFFAAPVGAAASAATSSRAQASR
jgi:hypothetical protein